MNKKSVIALVATSAIATTGLAATFNANVSAAAKKLTKITMFNSNMNAASDSKFNDPVAKVLKQKTGVELVVSYAVGDVEQKMAVMLASGDLPDMIYGGQDKFLAAKKFIDLEPLINKYGPNIKKLYGKYYNRLKLTDPKGKKILLFPSYGVGQKNWGHDPGQFQIQADVIKESGYKKITTLAQFESAIKTYAKKHPKINGKTTIPLTLNAYDWGVYVSINDPASFSGGYPGDGNWIINPKTGECKVTFASKAHHDFYKWLNHMNAIGLLDKETFMQKSDQYRAKMASGAVLATLGPWWEFNDSQTTLRKDSPERVFVPLPIVQKEGIKELELRNNGYVPAQSGIGITTSCKHPDKVVKFMDYICSDEGQILTHWGINGKNYTIVNGKRVQTAADIKAKSTDPNYNKKTGLGLYAYPFPEYGDGVKDKTGQYYTENTLDAIAANYGSSEKDILKHWNLKTFLETFPSEDSIPESKWGSAWQKKLESTDPVNVISKKIDDLMKASVPEMILAKPSQYEKKWDEWQKAMKEAGLDKYEDKYTKMVQDTMKAIGTWGK